MTLKGRKLPFLAMDLQNPNRHGGYRFIYFYYFTKQSGRDYIYDFMIRLKTGRVDMVEQDKIAFPSKTANQIYNMVDPIYQTKEGFREYKQHIVRGLIKYGT